MNCKVHADKRLEFVCRTCSTLECSSCFILKHSGHNGVDIPEAAQQAKSHITEKETELNKRIKTVQSHLREAENSLGNYESTVHYGLEELEEVHTDIIRSVDKVIAEIKITHEEYAAKGRKEQVEYIEQLKQKETMLIRQAPLLEKALQSQSDLLFMQTVIGLDSVLGPDTTVEALKQNAPDHTLEIIVDRIDQFGGDEMERLEMECKRLVGQPLLAHTEREYRDMAVVHRWSCSEKSDTRVVALYPLEGRKICVAYVESDENTKTQLCSVYDFTSQSLVKSISCREKKQTIAIKISSCWLHPFGSNDEASQKVQLDLDNLFPSKTQQSPIPPKGCYVIVKSPLGKYYVCDKRKTGKGTEVFKINVEDPVTICADEKGECFAVIQHPKTTKVTPVTKKASVALFQQPRQTRFALFQPNIEGFYPSDVCFVTIKGTEMLFVSDKGNSTIYIVNHCKVTEGNVEIAQKFASTIPWMAAPTAMAVDADGTLWVGSGGGHISACIQSEPIYAEPPDSSADIESTSSFDSFEDEPSLSSKQLNENVTGKSEQAGRAASDEQSSRFETLGDVPDVLQGVDGGKQPNEFGSATPRGSRKPLAAVHPIGASLNDDFPLETREHKARRKGSGGIPVSEPTQQLHTSLTEELAKELKKRQGLSASEEPPPLPPKLSSWKKRLPVDTAPETPVEKVFEQNESNACVEGPRTPEAWQESLAQQYIPAPGPDASSEQPPLLPPKGENLRKRVAGSATPKTATRPFSEPPVESHSSIQFPESELGLQEPVSHQPLAVSPGQPKERPPVLPKPKQANRPVNELSTDDVTTGHLSQARLQSARSEPHFPDTASSFNSNETAVQTHPPLDQPKGGGDQADHEKKSDAGIEGPQNSGDRQESFAQQHIPAPGMDAKSEHPPTRPPREEDLRKRSAEHATPKTATRPFSDPPIESRSSIQFPESELGLKESVGHQPLAVSPEQPKVRPPVLPKPKQANRPVSGMSTDKVTTARLSQARLHSARSEPNLPGMPSSFYSNETAVQTRPPLHQPKGSGDQVAQEKTSKPKWRRPASDAQSTIDPKLELEEKLKRRREKSDQ